MSTTAWILWTAPARGGAGTRDAQAVEVCKSERAAELGGPHHGFALACYRHEVDDDGNLLSEVWCWDTDEHGRGPWGEAWARRKVGWQQTRFLLGCIEYGGWYRGCGWQLHRNVRHDERLVDRLVERGLLVGQERVNRQGERFTLYTVADPAVVHYIVANGGYMPPEGEP